GPHVVGGVEAGGEHSGLVPGPSHAAAADERTGLERPEYHQEDARREVAEETASRHADGHAGSGDDRRERGGLDTEDPEDRDDQDDAQHDRRGRGDVAPERGVEVLVDEPAADQPSAEVDDCASDDPERDGADDADAEPYADVDRDLQHVSRFHSSDLPIAGRGLEP